MKKERLRRRALIELTERRRLYESGEDLVVTDMDRFYAAVKRPVGDSGATESLVHLIGDKASPIHLNAKRRKIDGLRGAVVAQYRRTLAVSCRFLPRRFRWSQYFEARLSLSQGIEPNVDRLR
jgi:hypothetical protein